MAGRVGRAVALTWGSDPVEGVREKGVSLNGEPVDVTSDEDSGWRTLLEEAGENQVNITISGVTKSHALRDAWFSGARTAEGELTYPDGSKITGDFFLASYSESEPYNDATTFDAELQSSGPVVSTPSGS